MLLGPTALFALSFIGIAFGGVPHPAAAIFGPMIYCCTALADIVASVMLFRTRKPSRSSVVLGLAFAANGALTLLTLVAVPLLPQIPAIVKHAPPGIWIYGFTHAAAIVGIVTYIGFRRVVDVPASRAFIVAASVTAVAALVSLASTLYALQNRLPELANGVSLTGFRSDGVGLVLIVAFLAAAAATVGLKHRSAIDRALVWAQLALGLDVLVTLLHGDRFSMSFYCSRVLQFVAALFVVAAAIRSRSELQRTVESDLRVAEAESRKRAARIDALWQIGASQDAGDPSEDHFATMLGIAADAIRPGRRFMATLSHLDRGSLTFDAVVRADMIAETQERYLIRAGTVVSLASSVQSLLYAEGTTQAWDDIQESVLAESTIAGDVGIRALIGSSLQIGRQTHFIVFSSPEPMDAGDAFDEADVAYIDVVAALFGSTFTQIEQVLRLRFQMEHDALTGLKNRVEFRKALRAQAAIGIPFAVALANLDGFRDINEVNGQMIADEVLVEISVALVAVDSNDLVARLGGDEFGILIRKPGDRASLMRAVAAYEEPFAHEFHTGDRDGTRLLAVNVSFGVARFPQDGETPERLVHAAGIALHEGKDRGGGSTVIYDRRMEERNDQRRTASADISNAVVNDQLRLVYQPTFDLKTRQIVGAEALVRWDHPEKGEIAPAHFIPIAEKFSVIGDISRWVFRRLIRDLSAQKLPPKFRCYFNMSTQDIEDPGFIATLMEALQQHLGLAENLGVEITESGIMKNVARSRRALDQIRQLGVRVAIDDFGTGHSSLAYLKQLSVDMVKIDRAFITGLPANDADAALTESMIAICERLDLLTLAEGIETEAQCAWLLANGCRYGQGYLVSRPLAFSELLQRIDCSAAPPILHRRR